MTGPGFSVVLVRPEIPHNTGAIGRLCVGLGVKLHLIRPLGFHLDDQAVARAGLDYWPYLDLQVHDTWEEYLAAAKPKRMFFLSTHGERPHYPQGGGHPGQIPPPLGADQENAAVKAYAFLLSPTSNTGGHTGPPLQVTRGFAVTM